MLRVFTAFSGYDSQCLALDVLEEDSFFIERTEDSRLRGGLKFEYELVGWSEIDKYAIRAHNALFPQWADRNYGDISKIDWNTVPDFDLFTYHSPCQDFSQAGKQRGGAKGSGTRSSLLWECERAIETKRPKYLLFENVAAVVSKKFIRLFNEWQLTLERLGYTNFTQVLNAKTHGYPTPVPQNRERVFMVSILDCDKPFYFPEPQTLTQRLADILEPEVDESYYLSDGQNGTVFDPNGIAPTICASNAKNHYFIMEEAKEHIVLGWTRDEKGNVTDWHPVDAANAVTAAKRDNTQNYVIEQIRKKHPNRGIFWHDGKAYYIRKLTPRECFRLMGVSDADIDKIQAAGISKSQQYKMAGNSIVVNTLAAIFRQLFIGNFNKVIQTEIF